MAASGFKIFTAVHKEWPIQLYRDQWVKPKNNQTRMVLTQSVRAAGSRVHKHGGRTRAKYGNDEQACKCNTSEFEMH